MAAYKGCELEPIRRFIEGIQKDIDPVTQAVVEEYSNGFVEGTNNKLKVIKRIGYGRCKLPLLKCKIVLAAFWAIDTQFCGRTQLHWRGQILQDNAL